MLNINVCPNPAWLGGTHRGYAMEFESRIYHLKVRQSKSATVPERPPIELEFRQARPEHIKVPRRIGNGQIFRIQTKTDPLFGSSHPTIQTSQKEISLRHCYFKIFYIRCGSCNAAGPANGPLHPPGKASPDLMLPGKKSSIRYPATSATRFASPRFSEFR